MNENEQVQPEEIHEAIGLAATYLMNSRLPIKADNLVMVLRAQEVMATCSRQRSVLEATRHYLMQRRKKPL
ncbi:hypothetical protein [Citrobacter sp. BDA59-3]|uniref:hypothetical protein n=1 Tax=Citrobacter sp. BDA59-3 TaxID=2781952 RepID=UPI00187DF488|nr:hypothetical protein [Citrobacter sp. BDA59-3]QOV69961.1 hypothetical protein IP582_06025 [Citrobacter sp. BDA59-3]